MQFSISKVLYAQCTQATVYTTDYIWRQVKCKRACRGFFSRILPLARVRRVNVGIFLLDNVAIIRPGALKMWTRAYRVNPTNPINWRRHPIGACTNDMTEFHRRPLRSSFSLGTTGRVYVHTRVHTHAQSTAKRCSPPGLSLSTVSLATEVVQPSFASGRLRASASGNALRHSLQTDEMHSPGIVVAR